MGLFKALGTIAKKVVLPLAKQAAKDAALKELDKRTGGLASKVDRITKDQD